MINIANIARNAMSWARFMRPASFRNVTFIVDTYGEASGRRGPDHEYPGRDAPWAEDTGLRQRTWRLSGYVIGDDYPTRRDALIAACKAEGPGELVHPTIGAVQAVCRSYSCAEQNRDGRIARFDFDFREAGAPTEPAQSTDQDSAIGTAADPLGGYASDAFMSAFQLVGFGQWIVQSAVAMVQSLAALLQQLRFPTATAPQSALGLALAYLNDNAAYLVTYPEYLVARVDAAFAAFTDAGDAWPVVSAMLSFIENTAAPEETPGTTPDLVQDAINADAFRDYTWGLALREIGYAITGIDFDNFDQALAFQSQLISAFWRVENAAADAGNDDVFAALVDLRCAITRMINGRIVGLNPLVTYRVISTTPANSLTLAWRLYQDSGRDLEICRRVDARNPPFLPMTGRVKAA